MHDGIDRHHRAERAERHPVAREARGGELVLGGFTWMDTEAVRRSGKEFSQLGSAEQRGICDDICDASRARAERRDAARFFARYRDLTAGGFYTTPAGRKDLDYVGNVPLTRFDGPPAALLVALGLP